MTRSRSSEAKAVNARFLSNRNRDFSLGPFPAERLARVDTVPDLRAVPVFSGIDFAETEGQPRTLRSALSEYQAMLDAVRDGFVAPAEAECPADPIERARHMKSFAYFQDAPAVGVAALSSDMWLSQPIQNPETARLAQTLKTGQVKSLASNIDAIMAELKEGLDAPLGKTQQHTHALVLLYPHAREARPDEAGYGYINGAQAQAAGLRATETAVILASYLRVLGFEARAQSCSSTNIDLNHLAVRSGLAVVDQGRLVSPLFGPGFELAAVTTTFEMAVDQPLAALAKQPQDLLWSRDRGAPSVVRAKDPYVQRDFCAGPHPFETLKRVDKPTTYIDEARVARVPKRTDMFARSKFGDMGKANQEAGRGGYFTQKSPMARALKQPMGALLVLQHGAPDPVKAKGTEDAQANADAIKAAAYFMGVDAVGISACAEWVWYSHDANGEPIEPAHPNAISFIIDQGFDTTEGSSGDDWIAVVQSMRAYLRFSLLGGIIAKHIRNLGYSARTHTNMDSEVVHPPLLLLSGLGEVSRIGEVIVNPFLGPRLKSGVITTDFPLAPDKPIDFGMQAFCESCNKCARECPAGAITAGPKLMFNGYEIWKSDSQKCTTYRITQKGGSMCGRCMKTCPWNAEGLQHERPLRWMAMNVPAMAGMIAKMDDWVGNGEINPRKRWWWDLKIERDGTCKMVDPDVEPANYRALQPNLKVEPADQTLAVYPANLAPHPWPFPFPMDREKGIEAYQAMITAEEYQRRLDQGEEWPTEHRYQVDGEAPVVRVEVTRVEPLTPAITLYELSSLDGQPLPPWSAGAHLDVVVTPEYFRQYSLCGDPADCYRYLIAVLREPEGRGGSKLLHRIFEKGRKVFVSKPLNHFPLAESASEHILIGGGIGVTPMIAFAHACAATGQDFSLHYSVSTRRDAGFLELLKAQPWFERVILHVSDEGTRADFDQLLSGHEAGQHVYTCGPESYMSAVMDAAQRQGFPEDHCHLEYFSVPELPDYENKPFRLKLARSGQVLDVPADRSAADVLIENGRGVDLKCSDGICGVCQCTLRGGEVEHRDFVLSNSQRQNTIILCQSRAKDRDGLIEIDL